jgi:citrate synthase
MLIKSMSLTSFEPMRMLESDEAARRLGVKVSTLYAYVSRGLLVSHRAASGRRSLFEVEEVERLARRSRQGKVTDTRMATITTAITQLSDEGPIYRGRKATEMAASWSFEEVAEWLWETTQRDEEAPQPRSGQWRPFELELPPDIGPAGRMRWVTVMAGARDPLRADLRPEAVTRAARRLAASMVAVAGETVGGVTVIGQTVTGQTVTGQTVTGQTVSADDGVSSMAARLASALSSSPTPEQVRAVNAALVLMADHELATSTMAVRMAASTRADIYDALLAGLGTIAGPLHGGASRLAYSLLADAERFGAPRALDETLRWQGVLPGFGHSVYKNGDARAGVLFDLFESMADPAHIEVVQSVIALARAHTLPLPNVDLAMAAISWSAGMPPEAGQILFTVARVVGWVAHYLEELGERPLRYRARAVYASGR